VKVIDRFLLVNALGDIRISKRLSARTIREDEVAFRLKIHIPAGWGRQQESVIDLQMPDPPTVLDTTVKE
jgi:hypothetical protein